MATGYTELKNTTGDPKLLFFSFSILFYLAVFFVRNFDQYLFLLTGILINFIFWARFLARSPGLFLPEVDRKEKVGQKSASFFVKRSKKSKSCQKSAFLIVKRSKKQKNVKNVSF